MVYILFKKYYPNLDSYQSFVAVTYLMKKYYEYHELAFLVGLSWRTHCSSTSVELNECEISGCHLCSIASFSYESRNHTKFCGGGNQILDQIKKNVTVILLGFPESIQLMTPVIGDIHHVNSCGFFFSEFC